MQKFNEQETQLSQTVRAMLHVVESFAVTQDHWSLHCRVRRV